jgi:phage-related minor tail protein
MTELLNKTIEDGSAKAGKALTESLTNAIRTGKGLFSSLKDFVNTILTDIANAIIRKQFVNPIVNALTGSIMPSAAGGSGIGSGFSSWLGNLFGGGGGSAGGIPAGMSPETLALAGLATGGPAQANTPYLIGEAGPELFVPNTNGTVVPNDALGGNIVVNLNLSAIDTQSGVEFLVKNRATITGVIQSAFNRNAKVGIA